MSVTERPADFHVHRPAGPHTHLEPFAAFERQKGPGTSALVVLNTPLHRVDVRALWAHSPVHVCADGGANRLYEYFADAAERARFVPTYITGDCDSLRPDVRAYYESRGCTVIPQYGQYASDFMKAIKVVLLHGCAAGRAALQLPVEPDAGLDGLVERLVERPVGADGAPRTTAVHVAGGVGGRLDQTFQLINQMYAVQAAHAWVHVVFFTPQDVVFLAPRGVTYVTYSARAVFNARDRVPRCGLLPFGRRTVLSSRGLLYDVAGWPSEIGGAVSSSNGVCGTDGFVVESSEDVVVSVEVSRALPRPPSPVGLGSR
ncbi:Thiamin pyrophosphokinase [Metschnikowia bicuspidata var. bicuspidata NRRL YB-4993]|uniref:Thiamine pyrophosphokinase n=1 Tax=Metschnikowia bicuspidata var. bicuspidata NRRL YB-4993 TaxID=869754 RepID=A0A1A0HCF4_9ASCO|nr:Thiamin pyrophosphokinase [Metschnikowia bicuspidata var. bicuspidata NRRL YB-4993]OBA21675.1 Thiamin pyrophosphokinase [Metschnikowia bicuspidata var. bicuspidata NRRL YB-4993]